MIFYDAQDRHHKMSKNGKHLKVKLLSEFATVPRRPNPIDVGYDLYSAYDCVVEPGTSSVIKTDIAVSIPLKHYGRIISSKFCVLNPMINTSDNDPIEIKILDTERINIAKGDKVAQLVLERCSTPPVMLVDELDELSELDWMSSLMF